MKAKGVFSRVNCLCKALQQREHDAVELKEVIRPGPQSSKWAVGRGESGAAGGAKGRDLIAKPGSLDYPPKKKESLKVFRQETCLYSIAESGHNGKAGLGEGKHRSRQAGRLLRWLGEDRTRVEADRGDVKDTEGELSTSGWTTEGAGGAHFSIQFGC